MNTEPTSKTSSHASLHSYLFQIGKPLLGPAGPFWESLASEWFDGSRIFSPLKPNIHSDRANCILKLCQIFSAKPPFLSRNRFIQTTNRPTIHSFNQSIKSINQINQSINQINQVFLMRPVSITTGFVFYF